MTDFYDEVSALDPYLDELQTLDLDTIMEFFQELRKDPKACFSNQVFIEILIASVDKLANSPVVKEVDGTYFRATERLLQNLVLFMKDPRNQTIDGDITCLREYVTKSPSSRLSSLDLDSVIEFLEAYRANLTCLLPTNRETEGMYRFFLDVQRRLDSYVPANISKETVVEFLKRVEAERASQSSMGTTVNGFDREFLVRVFYEMVP